MLRLCTNADTSLILAIINNAARRYEGAIPAHCYHTPYMTLAQLQQEMDAGVVFQGYAVEGNLVGVMGLQRVHDACLIRHAYVVDSHQGKGIGKALLQGCLTKANAEAATNPVLMGTWRAAHWAIRFYAAQGFDQRSEQEKTELLARYWTIPHTHEEASVVLRK